MIKRGAMRPNPCENDARFPFGRLLRGPSAPHRLEPSQSPVIHHDLVVALDPANHRLKVRDRIRIPGAFVTAPFTVSLNADLNVQAASGGLKLRPGQVARAGFRFRHGPRRS